MKKLYVVLLALFFALAAGVGLWSFLDEDQALSTAENRMLTQAPDLNTDSLLWGDYTTDFETYYADQFPLRESLRSWNRTLNKFYYYSGTTGSNVLVLDYASQAEQGGEAITAYQDPISLSAPEAESALQTRLPADAGDKEAAEIPLFVLDLNAPPEEEASEDVPEAESSTETAPEEEASAEQEQAPVQEAPTEAPETDQTQNEVFQNGSILILDNRAMDVPYATYSLVERYANTLSAIAADLGSGVRVFSLLTPNAAAFYAPDSFRQGNYNQQTMIGYAYGIMQGVTTVPAYEALAQHTDEYVYFRTDHHWTALGAYYAYTAFCEQAGFSAVPLSSFQTGRYDTFLGSLYGYTSQYPQSQVLADNPDYLDYYLPLTDCTCTYYYDVDMLYGTSIPVVSTNLGDSVSNKYLCFVGGDFPLEKIETGVDGPVCVLLKESYGNAMVPFLTSHYSTIYLIDPREFNRSGEYPSLNLKDFAQQVGADDVIVLNYPFMVTNESYITWLDYLVHTPTYDAVEEETNPAAIP